jgi:hypothetical protein
VRPNAPDVARSHSRRSSERPSAAIRKVPDAARRSNENANKDAASPNPRNASRNAVAPNAKAATSDRPVYRTRREAREAARAQARATREQRRAEQTQARVQSRVQARIQDRINARLARQNRRDAQNTATTGSISRAARTNTAAATIGRSFAGRHAAHAGWYRDWRRHRRAHGWYGPLYWPYAYDSLFANVFIPYDDYGEYAYDPFWDYGYGDIYAGIFSPYDYDDLLTTQAPAGERRYAAAPPQGTSETTAAVQQLQPMCGDDSKDVAGVPVDEIQKAVNPDEKQLAALDELGNASVKAAQIVKASCPADIAMTAPARIDDMKQRIDAMIEAVALVRKPLEDFYGMLSDEQKARFNAVGQREEDRRASDKSDRRGKDESLARTCGMTGATTWPQAQIERSVKPTSAQQKELDALRDAADQAAEQLKAACPSDAPATPVERLAAVEARLHAMHDAITAVQAPLKTFYGSLSDAQKAKFNAVGRSRSREG